MITYAKVLELGLKHDPIENPESYSWTQINDTAVCGPLIDGRNLEQPEFNYDMSIAITEFVDTQRAKYGDNLSFLIVTSNGNGNNPTCDSVAAMTGNYMNLAEGLHASMDKDEDFKMTFKTVGILKLLNKDK